MQVTISDYLSNDVKKLSQDAGFKDVGIYVEELIRQHIEVLGIQKSLSEFERGEGRDFFEFDKEFRKANNIPASSSS